jgi:hypothetical protein
MILKNTPPVLDKNKNPVPFRSVEGNEGNGAIDSYWLSYDEYSKLDEVFCQRDTEGRLKKAQKHLSVLRPEHCVVSVAMLTEDDEVFGIKYNAGHKFILDSNTRNLNWSKGGADQIPQEVLVIEYSYDSCESIRESYNTFDSSDALERNQEKLYGILVGMYHYAPKSRKFKMGQILTGLNKACNFYFPDTYTAVIAKPEVLPGQVGVFIEEIKALDNLLDDSSAWDQALVCAALMALKKYGTDNDRLNEGLKDINDKAANTKGKELDGISHIVDEWKINNFFPEKNTRWGVLDRTVSYCLYWIDKYMKGEKGFKPGNGWDKCAEEYKDQTQGSLAKYLKLVA